MKLIIQIPAYNEEKTIADIIKNIPKNIDNIDKIEILVMDDGSSDQTANLSRQAGANYVFSRKKNIGLGNNFKSGIDATLKLGADIIVNIDGDGQFDPQDIPKLVKPIVEKEAQMVTGSRFLDKNTSKNVPWLKRMGNKYFSKLISQITGQKFSDTQCGFRAYSKEAALQLNLFGKFTYTQEAFIDLAEKGIKIVEVPIAVKYFKERKSKISGNLIFYGFRSLGIIANTTRDTQPLSFFGVPGLLLFVFGFAGGLFSFVYWIIYLVTTPIKTLFIVSVFFMTFGTLLIIFGLLADMIKRVKKTQEKILYHLRKKEFDKFRENSESKN
ncbi:glycosyltransferase family 2 protein [Patescibacteria group bacterium]|nr:glycosyltransferase family 2 protein [Patescibacteria group bacterium]